ncbi:MAG: MMPL family transporter [Deltaproteobacteria bacterium]|nr:MMPL family transporter [Deltaproteobacteria bacterium]
MVEFLVRQALRFRLPFVAVILALTTVSAIYFSVNFGNSDNSLPVWFEPDDPDYVAYQDYLREFGNDRFILLGFEVPEVFSPPVLRFVQELTEELKKVPDVEKVTGITNVEYIDGTADEIRIHPFIESVPGDEASLLLLREKALGERDFVGNLISADTKILSLVAKINTGHTIEESSRLKKRIDDLVARVNREGYPFYLAGSPITDEAFDRLVIRDQQMFIISIITLVVVLLVVFFRSAVVAVVPTAVQVSVLMWVLALYYLVGYRMNVVGGMMVPILIAVCIADSVHLVLEYYHSRAGGLHRDKALIHAAKNLWRPCLYTAMTTLAGFVSFQSSSIRPINALGTLTAVGVALAFLLTIFFIPVVLSYLPEPKKKVVEHLEGGLVRRLLEAVTSLLLKRHRFVAFVFIMFAAMALIGMTKLKVETNFLEYFPPWEKVRGDLEFFNRKLSGVGSYEVVLTAQDPSWEIARDPQVLKEVDRFGLSILNNQFTREVQSHVDTIKKINQAFHEGGEEFYRVPDTREEVAQLLLLAQSGGETEIDQYKSQDDKKIHLTVRTEWGSSERMNAYLSTMRGEAENRFKPFGIQVLLTGYGPLWIRLDHDILASQISSFIIAFAVVSIMMMMFLKSWKIGLLSMVPNVLPIVYTMGIMGFAGIHLNVSTVMIAAITVGITVDDTIHYLVRFGDAIRREGDYGLAIRRANRTVGTAILFTSCILMGGFSVMCLGSFIPSIYFGAMTALTLFLAILCEIFLTPILLLWFKPFKS